MGLIQELLLKKGANENFVKGFGLVFNIVFYSLLFYAIITFGFMYGRLVAKPINKINADCEVMCDENDFTTDEFIMINESGLNVNWYQNYTEG